MPIIIMLTLAAIATACARKGGIEYFQFWNERIRINFDFGTTGSRIFILERQSQI
jgi:hypothetical protein